MTTIAAGMTPSEFIAAMNSNFYDIDILEVTDITAIAASSTPTIIDANFDSLNGNNPNPVTVIPIAAGMSGANFISSLNSNFTNIENSIPATFLQDNEIYVSNDGDDGGLGTLASPYLTLAKVQTVLADSTKVLLKKGDEFEGKLDLSGLYNICIDSYDSGVLPKIKGTKAVTGWTDEGDNIWSKQDDDFPTEITNVFIGGVRALLANIAAGQATGVTTVGAVSTITDSVLSDADGYWDGAEIYIQYYSWFYDMQRVVSYASKTFTFGTVIIVATPVPPKIGDYYIIQNHKNCLTTQDTWAFHTDTKTLYVYSVAQPANVTVSYGDDLIYADNVRNLQIKNVEIYGATRCGVYLKNSIHLDINNIEINYSGIDGLVILDTQSAEIKDNELYEQKSNGILLSDIKNLDFQDNVIDRCDYVRGEERYIDNISRGINGYGVAIWDCPENICKYNEISNCGYSGLSNASHGDNDNFLVQYNYIHTVNFNHADGGAIYIPGTATSHGIVSDNILIEGSGVGVYVDETSVDECDINNNFIANFVNNLRLHYAPKVNFHDNTLYADARTVSSNANIFMSTAPSINNIINNNYFIHSKDEIYATNIDVANTNPQIIKNNKYFFPFGKVGSGWGTKMFRIGATELDLTEWIADESRVVWERTGEEEITPSTFNGSAKPELNFLIYLINPAKTTRVVTEAELHYNDYVDLDGVAQTYPFNIAPYGFKVLVRPT
jgi:hypothetical protein